MSDEGLESTNCITAEETRQVYLRLVASKRCGRGTPCLKDECRMCRPLLRLIEKRGDECEARGCTMRRCIYDADPVLV